MDAIIRPRAARRHSQRHRDTLRPPHIVARSRQIRHSSSAQPAEPRQIRAKSKTRRHAHLRPLGHTPPAHAHRHKSNIRRRHDSGNRTRQCQDLQHDTPRRHAQSPRPPLARSRGARPAQDPPRASPPPHPPQQRSHNQRRLAHPLTPSPRPIQGMPPARRGMPFSQLCTDLHFANS